MSWDYIYRFIYKDIHFSFSGKKLIVGLCTLCDLTFEEKYLGILQTFKCVEHREEDRHETLNVCFLGLGDGTGDEGRSQTFLLQVSVLSGLLK